MPKNFYTFLIIPKRKSSAKKITLSNKVLKGIAFCVMAVVKQGNMVQRGDIIGYVGHSGRSTGSHLHYSVTLNGISVNPRKYLN